MVDSSASRLVGLPRAPAWAPQPLARLLVLLGLTGFAITQPLLSILGEEPTFFTFRGATPSDIVAFSVLLAVLPALLLWGIGLVGSWIRPAIGWSIHLVTIAGLLFVTAVQTAKQAGLDGAVAQVAVGLGVAIAGVALYSRYEPVADWTRFTCVLPVLAVLSFVFLSPTSDLIDPPETGSDTAGSATSDAPNLLLVMLDELPTESLMAPDGSIDAVRFPNLAAFADESTWYRRHTSPAQSTLLAVPAVLSSSEPRPGAAIQANYPDNLFSLLAPTHAMSVVETATALCDPDVCPPVTHVTDGGLAGLAGESFDLWQRRITPGRDTTSAMDDFVQERQVVPQRGSGDDVLSIRPQAQADLLRTIVPADDPQFWYLHLMLPHSPWRTYPDGREYDPGPAGATPPQYPFDNNNTSGSWIAALTEQRHLLQLSYTDALVGELLDRLRDQGLYDDTVVVVTADHGVSFRLNTPRRSPVEENLDALAYVPLLVKDAGQRVGEVDDSNVSSADLVPTIASHLGVEMTWEPVGLPIGSPEQLDRGDEKEFYDFGEGGGGLVAAEFQGMIPYDGAARAPDGSEGWIRPITGDEDPIQGLLDLLGIHDHLGLRLDDTAVGESSGLVTLDRLDDLRDPPSDSPPGFVAGSLTDHRAEGDEIVLVEVNGQIVTGSPLITFSGRENRFFAMLPPDALGDDGNTIRLGILDTTGAVEVLAEP